MVKIILIPSSRMSSVIISKNYDTLVELTPTSIDCLLSTKPVNYILYFVANSLSYKCIESTHTIKKNFF